MATPLHSLQQKALTHAVNYLNSLGARFHIILPNGEHIGEPLESETRKRRPLKGPRNTDYLRSTLAGMKVGDVVEVRPQEGETDLMRFAKNVSGFLSKEWGNRTYMTETDKAKNHVAVMRTAESAIEE